MPWRMLSEITDQILFTVTAAGSVSAEKDPAQRGTNIRQSIAKREQTQKPRISINFYSTTYVNRQFLKR
jgi:hypothetical protein